METKTNRGGARPGAGRPRRDSPRTVVSMRIEPDIAEKFKNIAKENQISQSEMFSKWVDRIGKY
tara:strand:- start:6813 stop:7004 length:192 start_codon:yes stop_codon:yes gene_type:complete